MLESNLLNKRIKRIDDAMINAKPDCIPVISLCTTWAYYYAGFKPAESFNHPTLTADVFKKLYSDFYWDGILLPRNGAALAPKIIDLLGKSTYFYDKDGIPQKNLSSVNIMSPSEYPELIKDPYRFILEKVLPRRYALFNQAETAPSSKILHDFKKLLNTTRDAERQKKKENNISEDLFSIPQMQQASILAPIDYLFDYFRDFSGLIQDIKKTPELVRDAGLALVDFALDNLDAVLPEKGRAIFLPMHFPQFLSPKDFEMVYWPSFKRLIDTLHKRNLKIIYYFERKFKHLFDYLQELPNHYSIGLFDGDDLLFAKEKLGKNMCIAGGMPVSLLYHGSRDECLAYAKNIVDHVALDGGYIFTTNMVMLTPFDGKSENLKAVNNFIHQF